MEKSVVEPFLPVNLPKVERTSPPYIENNTEAPPLIYTVSETARKGSTPPPHTPPPKYTSVVDMIKRTNDENRIFRVLFISVSIVPLAMVALGCVCARDCPVEPAVPISMIPCGISWLVLILIISRGIIIEQKREKGKTVKMTHLDDLANIVHVAVICVFIISTLVGILTGFGAFNRFTTDPSSDDRYCNPVLLYFNFTVSVAIVAIFGLFILIPLLLAFYDGLSVPLLSVTWMFNQMHIIFCKILPYCTMFCIKTIQAPV